MAAPASAGNRFRQRKISTKQTLQILKQSQLSEVDNDDLQQRDLQEIETGVDKSEEDEVHLQKILQKTGLTHSADTYIPTPDASKEWAEAPKYYKGEFHSPDSYIKSSCQMEDYSGVLYNMDEVDEEFLKTLNQLTEDEFELMMYSFEKTINEKQPFLVTDPTHIMSFDEIKFGLFQTDKSSVENVTELLSQELKIHPFETQYDAKLINKPRSLKQLCQLYGLQVYQHFKQRKIERSGQSITPILKFNGDDDNDAYICFRQRQFRQQRKTRRADVQSSEKLVKLYRELKTTKELAFLVAQREQLRLCSLKVENDIFELRCKVKTLKRELGITDSDEDLITHKKKKVVPPPVVQPIVEVKDERKKGLSKSSNNANIDKTKAVESIDTPQQFQPYVKLPPSKIPDMELETVEFLLSTKERSVQRFVEEKMKKKRLQDVGYTNLTDDPNSPLLYVHLPYDEILDSKHLPYSSISSSQFDIESLGCIPHIDKYIEKGLVDHNDVVVFNPDSNKLIKKFKPESFTPLFDKRTLTSDAIMTLRKRVGRLGQIYVDRRRMVSIPVITEFANDEERDSYERLKDQWKFDDDGSSIEYFSGDPAKLNNISNETQNIRFGSMLNSKSNDSLKEAVFNYRQGILLKRQRLQQRLQEQKSSVVPQTTS